MSPKPTERALLLHVRDAIARIQEYTEGGREAFFSTAMVRDAVLRNLEIIGEAAKGLADATR